MKQQFIKIALFTTSAFFMISCGGWVGLLTELSGPYLLNSGPYFWKVQKDGKTSYFLGTYHIANTLENLQCSDKIKSHLENSDLLFVESDIHSAEQQDLNERLKEYREKAMLSEGGHEFKSLNEESQIFFRSRSIQEDLSYTGYTNVVYNLCRNQVKVRSGAGAISLDSQLKAISQANNIPVAYLDEGEDTDKISEVLIDILYVSDADSESVNKAVADFEFCISRSIESFTSYRKGVLNKNTPWNDEQKKVLLKDRNEKWVIKFKEAHGSGNYNQIFLAGGTAHFISDFNVLDMLEKEGFSISRMEAHCGY